MFNKMRSQAISKRLSPLGMRTFALPVLALFRRCTFGFSAVMLCGILCAMLSLPMPAQATPAPLKTHEAWQRLDTLAPDFPLAWAGRYRELKSIAEDADNYSLLLPLQLQQLRTVSMAAQSAVVTLLLDMVPAHANVHESSYILGLLKNWTWRLEPPLRRTISTASGLEHSLHVLAGIGSAVEEMQANTKKRPVMEKASQDFYDLYALVHERVQQLHKQLDSVRSVTQGIYNQIEIATVATEKMLPEKWIAYYTTPLIVTSRAFSRLGENFITMCKNWTYDKSYPTSVAFALVFNTLVIFSLMLAHTFLVRTAQFASQMGSHHTFTQSLCVEFFELNTQHKLAFGVCVVVMLNSIVDTLPQFHEGIPFLFIQHLVMLLALALWMRTSPADPKIWELALPVLVGQMLLHGDAGPLLTLLCMGGALLLSLISLLLNRTAGQSLLRFVWLAVLLIALLLTIMGFGRLTVPMLMLTVAVWASSSMLKVANNSPALLRFTMARTVFVPILTIFLGFMSVSFLMACSGLDALRNYWYTNAVPIFGFNVTFGDAFLTVLFLLGIVFISNISRQILENLSQDSRVLDASAVPVLHVVVNCVLVSIFIFFVLTSLGVDVRSLAFIGGGVSIGVGFAAKTILSNFFCGLVIIFSKVVRAGDMVEVNNISGRVLNVNMRATVVETSSNGILLVPNEEMLSGQLTNWSLNNLHILENITVQVAQESNMETVLSAMEDAAKCVAGILQDPQPTALFAGIKNKTMDFVLSVWVGDVRRKDATLSDVRKALRKTLSERGVDLDKLTIKRSTYSS